ncbi:Ig-like domain-containing protein [Pseudarthrobacter sp. L1SW]|uniref:Ig-like domain-containing protein n=1 Tax=Pseudarthrobacter sp. L1SW TaxID=2851598 RepID=UPI001E449B9C|nr:Ig-like domain-containing protein [Pseudarthrobacter sp. L1SW]UEL28569.1 Ig-like domain-containing protein [Pseudarthrobacter sp. L1SW]
MNNPFAREGAAVHDSVDAAGLRLRASRNLRLYALLTALLVVVGALVSPVAASAAAGDVGDEGPSHSGTGTPTGTKRAESVLWFNDGVWWGNLWDTASSDFHIFRFNGSTRSWTDTGVATETRANTHHDVLWDGTTLYVASHQFVNDGLPAEPNFPTMMRRYSYDSIKNTYSLLSSTQINNYKVETLSIDKDSTGRVWATWQQGNKIYLNVTGTDGKTWGTPFQHPATLSNVSVDDTSAVIAFDGKMGLMWSRQVGDATDGMYWSYHNDSDTSKTAWTAPVAAVKGQRSGDDHMNLKWLDSADGQVFAAIKTSFTSNSEPLIQLLALNATTSAWSAHTIANVAECPNRVIVLIDESTSPKTLRTFATYPKPSGTKNAGVCTSSGGAIYEKSAPVSDPGKLATAAKTPRIVDADQYVHNVTSTKQNLNNAARGTGNSGLLVLADVNATSRYWHFYEPSSGGGDTTAPTVTATSPAAGATAVAVSANVTGTFSEPMDAATVTSSTFTVTEGTTPVSAVVSYSGNVATLNPNVDLKAGTTYTAVIKGGANGVKDVAGNALASDKTWTFTTAAAGGGDTTAPTVTATSPAAGAAGVAVSADVTGTFSEPMDAATVSSSSFTVTEGTTPVSAVVSYSGNVATLNPNVDLKAGTTYTAVIKGGANGVKDVAGNALASDKTWSFTTAPASGGGTSETVTLTATADSYVSSGAPGTNYGTSTILGVDNSPVEITYLKFDLSAYAGRTLESATLELRSAGSGSTGTQNVKLVGDDSWTEAGITYSGTPLRPALGTTIGTLGPTTTNTIYKILLNADSVKGELGQMLSLGMDANSSDGLDLNSKEAGSTNAPKLVLTMSGGGGSGGGGDTTAPTVTATSPAAGAAGVAVSADVTGTFSEPMDAATVSSSSFTVTEGTTPVSAVVSYSGNVATLNPNVDLKAGTTYTAVIKGGANGVKDVAGNALASDKTWSFTTAPASGGGTSETVTLTATADSYVSSGAPGTNYGTSTILGVDNSPVEITYLKFDLSAYAGRTLESATLELRSAGSGSTGTQNVKLVGDDSWTEAGITYSGTPLRPALGTTIGTLGPTTTNTIYKILLNADSVKGELGQMLSLGMDANSSDGLDLNSKEAGSTNAPKLILTLAK